VKVCITDYTLLALVDAAFDLARLALVRYMQPRRRLWPFRGVAADQADVVPGDGNFTAAATATAAAHISQLQPP